MQKKEINESKAKSAPTETQASTAAAAGNGDQGGASVDKIRDILFGAQIKNYESRFERLEETLARESVDLKETMRRRLESLEGFFRKEAESLVARLKAEREERIEAVKAIAHDLKHTSEALIKKIAELDDKAAEADSGLRQELMQESRKLLEEVRRRHDALSALLERRVEELRVQKADRTALAALLTGMALQLNEDAVAGAKPVKAAKAG